MEKAISLRDMALYVGSSIKKSRRYHNFISGLVPTRDTDTEHDIQISVGQCMDSTNVELIELNTIITKQIDASWAVGDDAGGLDGTESSAGTPDADTWYYIWLIKRSDTGVVDALFSESSSAPTMPANYDYKRRLGAVLTDGSSNIIAFVATETPGGGVQFTWDVPINDRTANITTTAALTTMSVPPGHRHLVKVMMYNGGTSSCAVICSSPEVTDTAGGASNLQVYVRATEHSEIEGSMFDIECDTSAQLRFRASATTTGYATTQGWLDYRRS